MKWNGKCEMVEILGNFTDQNSNNTWSMWTLTTWKTGKKSKVNGDIYNVRESLSSIQSINDVLMNITSKSQFYSENFMNLRLYWHIIIIKILRLLFFCVRSFLYQQTLCQVCCCWSEEFIKDMIRRLKVTMWWREVVTCVSDSQSRSIRWLFCCAIYLLFLWVIVVIS